MRLLICDDYKPLLDALSMALMENGYTVVATAINPDKAVAAAREHQPDACLLDVNFPHANGLSAIARIHEVSADTKVVMLSGSIDSNLVADAIAQGAQGFVAKCQPVGVIVQALEQARQGHLAVDPIFMPDVPQPHATKDDSLSEVLPESRLVGCYTSPRAPSTPSTAVHAGEKALTGTNPAIPERSCPESRTRWHRPAGRTRRGRGNIRSLLQPRNLSCTTRIRGPIRITVPDIDSAGSWEIALATMC